MESNITTGDRLAQIREDLMLSQVEIAEKLGVSQSHIAGIESGSKRVSLDIALSLKEKFDVSMDWIFSGIGDIYIRKRNIDFDLEKSKNDVGFDVGFSQNHDKKTRQKEGKDKQNHNKLGVDFEKEKAFKIKMSEERGKEGMKLNALKLLIKQRQLSDIQEIITEFFYYSKAITYFFDKRVNPKHEWNELFITDYKQYIDDFIKVLSDLQVHREEIQIIIESMKAFVEKANIDTDEETNDYVKDLIDFF